MNREIKFRAWDKVNKKMMNWVDQIHWANGAKIESVAQTTPLQSHKRWGEDIILMQFTGLKDKNGKEIYEGDIVLVRNGIATDGTYKSKVLWFDEGCQWITQTIESDTGEWDVMQPQECGGFYEVVGNIYENPELLK